MKNPWKERERKKQEKIESDKKWKGLERKFHDHQREFNKDLREIRMKAAQRRHDVQQAILDMLPLIKEIHEHLAAQRM